MRRKHLGLSRRLDAVRVLVVDDHSLFAEALMLTLAIDERIEVVGCASSGAEAIALTAALRPDVVLMDVHMPNVDGIEATRRIRSMSPRPEVMMLTAETSAETKRYALAAGASRYVTKDTPARSLIEAVVGLRRPIGNVTRLPVQISEVRTGA
jgi:DNA-binding NarL/FixJ family response regulator